MCYVFHCFPDPSAVPQSTQKQVASTQIRDDTTKLNDPNTWVH